MIDLTAESDEDERRPPAAAPPPPQQRAAPKRVLDLTLSSDDEAPPARRARAAPAPAPSRGPVAPPWQNKRGIPRMFMEFSELRRWEGSPRIYDSELVGERADLWRFKVKDFDAGVKAGRDLNADLAALGRRKPRGQDHIVMEIRFPGDYPTRPFFLRCVSPRFVWYTGHVTAGGAICIEALTTSGGAGAWRPTFCVEGILNTVFTNMLHTEVTTVRTATGPGGRSGPLRVDLKGKFSRDPLQEYSTHEAQSAFDRMLSHHRANGW